MEGRGGHPYFPQSQCYCVSAVKSRHERQHYTTTTERNRSLFVKMKIKRGLVRSRVFGLVSGGQVDPGLGVAWTRATLAMLRLGS